MPLVEKSYKESVVMSCTILLLSFELESGQYQSFTITYTSCDVGSHDNIMIFSCNIVDEKNFMIVRFIRGQTAVPEMDHIKSTGAYSHPKPVIAIEDKDVDIVRGIPPER